MGWRRWCATRAPIRSRARFTCSGQNAFFAWNKGLALGGIAKVGQIQLLQPFVALAASAALLGETVGLLEIGFAVVVVGIVALGWRMRVARRY